MADSTRTTEPDLANLTADFDIVGELGTGPRTQYLIATRKTPPGKRRDDKDRVLVEVVHPPEGDESHALDHLASDTKLLSGLRHRRLVSIIEGRWLGPDAFAVIREYVDDPSVSDLLARGNSFTNTRIAAILREVHGVLQWARAQDVVHRHITPDRLFLEPTSDRVRVTFGAGPLQRVRTTDPTTEDVLTVVRLAVAMLTGGISAEEADGRSVAELRPDLPDRLFEETERLLREPATDEELTLYLALIGMADPVAEGETERDRIRAELVEEQRLEREKLAAERADLDRLIAEERQKLAEEGEQLRAAFAQDKTKLEREFAAEQRLLAAERVEMQRIIAQERAELQRKREAMQRELGERLAEIELAAAEDRAKLEALREKIQRDGERELERLRAAALEELEDSEIRLHTGKYATPAFVAPELAPFPELAFRDDDRLKGGDTTPSAPKLPAEPWSVTKVVRDLRSPRREPVRWKRWAVRGGIAAIILITAGTAVVVESRSPVQADTPAAPARATRPVAAVPAPAAPAITDSSAGGLGVAPDSTGVAATDSSLASASDSLGAATPIVLDSARAQARRDSVRRYMAAAAARARADSAAALRRADLPTIRRTESPVRREGAAAPRRPIRADPQDLMELSDSLAGSAPDAGAPEPPVLPQPNAGP
jgi:serine/threonine protein kinase